MLCPQIQCWWPYCITANQDCQTEVGVKTFFLNPVRQTAAARIPHYSTCQLMLIVWISFYTHFYKFWLKYFGISNIALPKKVLWIRIICGCTTWVHTDGPTSLFEKDMAADRMDWPEVVVRTSYIKEHNVLLFVNAREAIAMQLAWTLEKAVFNNPGCCSLIRNTALA